MAHTARDEVIRAFPSSRLKIDQSLIVVPCFMFIGLLVRLSFILPADFPLHDGGLFYAMIKDIEANHFALPWFTSYNSAHIPFAYPPLALFISAILNQVFKVDLIWMFRFLPFLENLLTGLAFYFLARSFKLSKTASYIGLLAFLLLPEAFRWLIMGGGLTRSLGFLFAILAIAMIYRAYTQPGWKNILLASLFSALTVVSHLEFAWFTAYSAALIFIFYGRNIKGIKTSGFIALFTLLLTSPWWVTVISRFGVSTYVQAISGGSEQFSAYMGFVDLLFGTTGEKFFPILGCLATVGAVIQFIRRKYFLPLWALTVILIQGRGSSAKAAVPLALLIGVLIAEGTDWLIAQAGDKDRKSMGLRVGLTGAVFLLICSFGSTISERTLISSLTADDRQAMQWVSQNTAPNAQFLILSADWWGYDRVSEWFPVLSQRQSVLTVQGYEFAPNNGFKKRVDLSKSLDDCVLSEDFRCVTTWIQTNQVQFSYLYIPKTGTVYPSGFNKLDQDCCGLIRNAALQSSQYTKVYENKDAIIFKKN